MLAWGPPGWDRLRQSMPVGAGAATASGLALGWVWRQMRTGTARPIERPSKRTSMLVRSNG